MSPASEGSSDSFTYSHTVSQNPNSSVSSNSQLPQSSCFSLGSDKCNGSLDFDFSNMGRNLFEQSKARRLRYPTKKLRRKLGSENTKRSNFLSSESLVQPDKNGTTATATSTRDDSSNIFSGSVGGNCFISKSSSENNVFVSGTCMSSSASTLSYSNGSFPFRMGKSWGELNTNFEYGIDKSSLQSDSNLKSENIVFGAEESSLPSSLSNENTGFVLGAKSGSNMESNSRKANCVVGNAGNLATKSTFDDGNFKFNSYLNNRSSSMNSRGADKMQNFDNVSFVFGAKQGELASDVKLKPKEFDGSGNFNNVGLVSSANKPSMAAAAENRIPKKEDHSDHAGKAVPDMRGKVKLDARVTSEKDGNSSFVFGNSKSDGGKMDNLAFVFGSERSGTLSTAELEKSITGENAGSSAFVGKDGENADFTNEFRDADTNGVFVFGCGGKDKLRSKASNKYRDGIDHLNNEKTMNNSDSMSLFSDAMRSTFKFVMGSSFSPGSAFYKVPLSKLFDEMKSLHIDDSKGITAVKVKDVRSNSHICSDHLNATQNNRQVSGFSTEKTSTTLQEQHENANVGGTVECSDSEQVDMKFGNQERCEYDYDSGTARYFSRTVMVSQPDGGTNTNLRSSFEDSCKGVNSSFASAFPSSGTTSNVQQNSSSFDAPPAKVENKENLIFTCTPIGPRTSSKEFNSANLNGPFSITNPFTELNKKFEFVANAASVKEKKLKKTRRKLKQRIPCKPLTRQDHLYRQGSSPNFESPGGYSPMDFSPCQNCADGTPASQANQRKQGDSGAEGQRSNIHENATKSGESDNKNSKGLDDGNLKSGTSFSAQDGLSAIKRQYRKKYKSKVGDGPNGKNAARRAEPSSSIQFSSYTFSSRNINKEQVQIGVPSSYHDKTDREHAEQDIHVAATHGVCEHWRIRGNQAYKIRDLAKAEEFYTKGINSAKDNHVSGICNEPLLLCYSNRAATRMSLGRMREALEDCKSAAALDPNFVKVKLRSANCHLVLGDFQEAMQYYNDCLESGSRVCLDRRLTIEAADGLQKSKKVAEYMSQSAELMQQRTSDAAKSALGIILNALSISCYSEKLLEMKGEALFLLQRYDEVIELCEHSLPIAEKNVTANPLAYVDEFECKSLLRLWRWRLMSKSQFHLGRLEVALNLIEKQEQLRSTSDGYRGVNPENPIPLAVTIRGLLEHKKAGNEAFQSGKHAEAVEHYTAAISSAIESRPFAAICFCNRAAAHQALGEIVDGIADCSLAIALDENYAKAVSRRATLHEMIRDYKQAIDDLKRFIALLENQLTEKTQEFDKRDRSSGKNKKELKQVRSRLSVMEDMAKKGTSLDLYRILGIKATDAESDIKKAYRKAALRHHPDKLGQLLARNDGGDDGRLWKDIVEKVHEDADRLFKMIGEAYAVLSDPDKRSKYDYEEELKDFCSDREKNMNSRRPSEFYSSPYNGGHWSSRQSNSYSSPSGRSNNRRNWQESWRSNDSPHSRW